jgi:hypothetical protein
MLGNAGKSWNDGDIGFSGGGEHGFIIYLINPEVNY